MKIKKGTTRIVFILENVVIKIPNFTFSWYHFVYGLIGNMQESSTWKYNSGRYNSGVSHLLCPVLWSSFGGWILIMKKAEPVNAYMFNSLDLTEHKKHFKGDDHECNYGWLDNKIVKIDYGSIEFHARILFF